MGGHPNKRTGGTPNKGQDNLTSVRCESDAGCPPLLGDPCVHFRCASSRITTSGRVITSMQRAVLLQPDGRLVIGRTVR